MRVPALLNRPRGGIGWPGAAGVGLVLLCGAFYLAWLQPETARLATLHQEAARLRALAATLPAAPAAQGAAEKLNRFYGFFPRPDELPGLLETIYDAAGQQSLRLEQGEYRTVADNVGKLVRYQITLPVQGSYPQIRSFTATILGALPALGLENIEFERQKIGDATVAARIRLVVYLEQTP